MRQIRESYKKTGRLHHAYGISGDKEKVKKEIFAFLINDLKFSTQNNPDFWQGEFNVFKIADGRALNEAHMNKPVKHERKVFVILANSITKDAQNSLLKIFEEPRADTTFFINLPSVDDLLPTLKSRLNINRKEKNNDSPNAQAEEFLEAKVGKRLALIAKIVKDIKEEKINKSDAIVFIKNLEKIIKANWKTQKGDKGRGKNILAVEDLEKAISYAGDESPSIKVILEHLATTL